MIRPGLLESERFLTLPDDRCRLAFVAAILKADDLGNLEANPGDLRRLWRDLGADNLPEVERIRAELARADLIRCYEVDGKSYAHLPRFRQRLRYYKRANPRPPAHIEDKEISEIMRKQSDQSRTRVGLQSAEVKRSRSEVNTKALTAPLGSNLQIPTAEPVDNFSGNSASLNNDTAKPNGHSGQQWGNPAWVAATAKLVDLKAAPLESQSAFRDRVYAALQARLGNQTGQGKERK